MMYSNKLAVAVKNNGKVLREFKDTVFLPYGAEYSILIKNLNSIRAIVHVTIDGENMSRDGIVVDANSEVELERMLKQNLNEGNRFKFIERTGAIDEHRGVKLEDGVIRIEYQFEEPVRYRQPIFTYIPSTTVWRNDVIYNHSNSPIVGSTATSSMTASSNVLRSASINNVGIAASAATSYEGAQTSDFIEQGYNDAGITVPGSISNQKFREVASFPLQAEKHVMIFKLLGETPDNEPIRRPVTVKAKPKCQTCGKQNKAHAKFCSACGTSLTVLA